MASLHLQPRPRPHARLRLLGRLTSWCLLGVLGLLVGAQLIFFAIHAAHMLGYPFPLDYGEGPLLAQLGLLRGGLPIWQLYANPDQPPYAVVNYPPAYPLAATLVTLLAGDALLAGRLVSLAAALAAVAALWLLTREPSDGAGKLNREPKVRFTDRFAALSSRLIVLAFLAIPIVREWAVVVRVDMLGVALGLWALVLVRRGAGRPVVLWAALPLALCLLAKPSLIAAPAAALLWLLFRDWRRALQLAALTGAIGAAAVGALHYASGGWFLLHVLAANANAWQARLAYGFWRDQLAILWPLVGAASLGAAWLLLEPIPSAEDHVLRAAESQSSQVVPSARCSALLPLYYTLFGAIVAYGVGKVGAYTNYFLEFYAGLIWLAGLAAGRSSGASPGPRPRLAMLIRAGLAFGIVALVAAAQLRYYPLWSETYLKTAGLIEGVNPPRLTLGRYGVWQDLRRERDLLAAFGRINAALSAEVRAAGGPLFTDIPGVAAQAGVTARLQAFEYRQLLDAGLADQRGLLRELASGQLPLVALDYLGNWLTPEMITLITHRYAQAGSRGTYDLYRPIDPGPATPADQPFASGLRLQAYHLASAAHPGETALLTLDWRYDATQPAPPADLAVVAQLQDQAGTALLEFTRPLLYGALAPRDWADATVQHLQPLALPIELPPGSYRLAIALRDGEHNLAPLQPLARLAVEPQGGRPIGERGYFVPAPLLDAWRQRGDGPAGPGDPLMPAVRFQAGTLQCFVRACFQLTPGGVQPLPLGELISLADAGLQSTGAGAPGVVSPGFRLFWEENGGAGALGPPIAGEQIRGDRIVQYTRYARLERPLAGGAVRLGRLGDEFLRLPGGGPYRWPEYPP